MTVSETACPECGYSDATEFRTESPGVTLVTIECLACGFIGTDDQVHQDGPTQGNGDSGQVEDPGEAEE